MCNIKTESNEIPEKPKFTLSKEDGMQKLQIVFPEESEERRCRVTLSRDKDSC